MSLEKLGINLAQQTASWVKAAGKTSVLQTKPINTVGFKGLHLAPNLTCDTVQLSNTSYVSEPFVKSLTEIKGEDKLDTIAKIKDAILRKMGYTSPESLEVKKDSVFAELFGRVAGWNNESGEMVVSQALSDLPVRDQIPLLYHELDHMDKHVKLYKAVGAEKYYEIIEKSLNGSREPKINFEFFNIMSKNVDITNFDTNKYMKAASEYEVNPFSLSGQYKYLTNPFESAAYELEDKISDILGSSLISPRETFPKNYQSLLNALRSQGVTDAAKQEEILINLDSICLLKNIDKNLVEAMYKMRNNTATQEESERLEKLSNEMMKNPRKYASSMQKSYLEVEAYINKGILTLEDLMNNMNH